MIGLKVLFILSVMIALGNAAPSEGSLDTYTYVPNADGKGMAITTYLTLSEAKASCSANKECKQIVDKTCEGKLFWTGLCDSSPCERISFPGSCSWFKVSGESAAFDDQGRTLNIGNALSRSIPCRLLGGCSKNLFGRASRSRIENETPKSRNHKKCGTNNKNVCPSHLQCQGYMGTSANVMSGYCQKKKELGEVCGKMSAGKPNENHFTFVGDCSDELRCIQKKCVKEA